MAYAPLSALVIEKVDLFVTYANTIIYIYYFHSTHLFSPPCRQFFLQQSAAIFTSLFLEFILLGF